MFNPFEFSLKIQQVAMEGAAASARMMADNYMRFIEQQSHLLHHSLAGRRDEDPTLNVAKAKPARGRRTKSNRGKKSPCSGPDLLDHYGKRAHDVDVEHI